MDELKMPPLGLLPKKYWEITVKTNRCNDILEAINRYVMSGKVIPKEWMEEYNELVNEIK